MSTSGCTTASDWAVFRRRVPERRERYLWARNEELAALLRDGGATPTERFWRAREQMGEEARVLRACLDGHSRGRVAWYLLLMYGHGIFGAGDLGEFSEGLQAEVRASLCQVQGGEG